MVPTANNGTVPASDLIAAAATPAGRGGISVVRVSGAGLSSLEAAILNRPARPGRICRRSFLDHAGRAIDSGLALRFVAPASYTGENVLELHAHGGPAVLSRLLKRCCELGARLAGPGEFTQRAFLNGRLDLAQAEGIADLINAATERAATMAAASARGELSTHCLAIDGRLKELRADLEAELDFGDEDIAPPDSAQLRARCGVIATEINNLCARCSRSVALCAGARVALIGAPNVGKSSLLNQLAGTELAIVDAQPGTTRDIVHATCDIHGLAVNLADTAGLRSGAGRIEREGMRRARAAAEVALVILVEDASAATEREADWPQPDLVVRNKIDLVADLGPTRANKTIALSARTGEGIELLRTAISEAIGADACAEEDMFLARARHVEALSRASSALAEAATMSWALPETAAEVLRQAHNALGEISGRTVADNILDEIFARFCIGK